MEFAVVADETKGGKLTASEVSGKLVVVGVLFMPFFGLFRCFNVVWNPQV